MNSKFSNNEILMLSICSIILINFEANAQETVSNQEVQKVIVKIESNTYSGQREVLAGKIVLGREWLEKSAASTVAEALRRESSVTVAAGGKISLKGLAGYTQILIDGQPATGSGKPLEMNPALVERVEIIHSATAESGMFAIAGTINIVTRNLRKALPKQLTLNGGTDGRGEHENVTLLGGWRKPSGETFNVTGDVSNRRSLSNSDTTWSWLNHDGSAGQSIESNQDTSFTQRMTFNPSWTWKSQVGDEIVLKGAISTNKDGNGRNTLITSPATANGGVRPLNTYTEYATKTDYLNLDTQWRHKLDNQGLWTASLSAVQERANRNGHSVTQWTQSELNHFANAQGAVKDYLKARWQLSWPNRNGHRVQFAVSEDIFLASENQNTMINGVTANGNWLGAFHADMRRSETAAYLQDDWNISETVDLKLGLRQTLIALRYDSGVYQSKLSTSLTAPTLNLAWQLDSEGARTFTLDLARTFSRIGSAMLNPRPEIMGGSRCTQSGGCGANDPNQADQVGNPALKYEHAWGLDAAFENQFREASSWSLRAYRRWIKDSFAYVTQLENVPWSNIPRWVNRPMNRGEASAYGVTVGVDTQMSDWMEHAPNLGINASLQWNQSSINTVRGPDNRLEGQPAWSGRLAITYKPTGMPLELQGDLLINPANWWQASKDIRIHNETHRDISVKAIWTFSATQKLVVSLQNLVPTRARMQTLYAGNLPMQSLDIQRPRTTLSVRFETKFD
jgi:iron complex outermembrane receptor protein